MGLFTMVQILIYFLTFLQITCTAIIPTQRINQKVSNTILPKAEERLSLADSAEWIEYNLREPEGPGTYSFGYDVDDPETGNVQFRTEERSSNGTVTGSYGYVATDGTVFVVHYIADNLGYRTKIEQAKLSSQGEMSQETNYSEDISPEMESAILFLTLRRGAQEDQHSRPIDQNNYNNNKIINKDESKEHVSYDVNYVPANTKLI